MHIYSFEKLEAWQSARQLTKKVYQATKKFPKEEQFGLTNQIRRSSVSICSNLAEGTGRHTQKDRANFSTMAYSSLLELLNQLIISNDLEFISDDELQQLRTNVEVVSKKISGLRASQLN